MTAVLIADWLGRGGIAQTAQAWAEAVDPTGGAARVVTRGGREIAGGVVDGIDGRYGGLRGHERLTREIALRIRNERPATVVIQNFLVPALDQRVHAAARAVGAKVVFVVHDDRLHARTAGTHVGLRRLVERADVVVAHSRFVADRVSDRVRRPVEVVPLPAPVALLRAGMGTAAVGKQASLLALHFGVVKRAYKGGATFAALAEAGVDEWSFASIGAGARPAAGIVAVNRFLHPADLVATVAAADAVVLPYRFATQSGAVVLAQALRRVVVVSAVGGIVEQVENSDTGLLVPAGAPLDAWRAALAVAGDPLERDRIGDAAAHCVAAAQEVFAHEVRELVR